jgi:hypothetical protein
MIVGVDTSHIPGKRTGVAMTASMNGDFSSFYTKQDIIEETKKEQLVFCVSAFLEEALVKFFELNKNNKAKLPNGIIIYRQGVSKEQKEFLKTEIDYINKVLSGKMTSSDLLKGFSIPYYYVLVNTKTTFKFFETEKQQNKVNYYNPEPGLLVIDQVTSPSFYEFYIQPQQVTGGTATPTLYHVAFGNMEQPEFLPKFTFDLCYQYPNWQGPVRIPGVLKLAEKLSKMTAKYTKKSLNDGLKDSLSYL